MYLFKQIFTVLNIYTLNTKIMPNYRYGKNYEIVCHTTDKIYIGSTCQPLDMRLAEHERSYKNKNYTSKYCTAFEILGCLGILDKYPALVRYYSGGVLRFPHPPPPFFPAQQKKGGTDSRARGARARAARAKKHTSPPTIFKQA
jgi:hypothetical protein